MNLKQLATFKHLNIRKEGDQKILTIDLKILTVVEGDSLIEFHPSLRTLLWNQDEPRFKGLIKSVALIGELGRHDAKINHVEMRDCTLRKFDVTPLPMGMGELAFTVTTRPESGKTVSMLSEFISEQVEILVHPEGDLFGQQHKERVDEGVAAWLAAYGRTTFPDESPPPCTSEPADKLAGEEAPTFKNPGRKSKAR
jgi:hypothetical protein